MKNKYEFGKEFEFDEIRANVNISKVLLGKVKRKNLIMKGGKKR